MIKLRTSTTYKASAVSITVISLLIIGLYWVGKPTRSVKTQPPTVKTDHTPIPAAPQVNYTSQPYGDNINRAQAYLNKSFSQISPVTRLILDYLQRKYGLDPKFSAAVTPLRPPIAGQQIDLAQFQVFNRISYPGDLVGALPSAKDDPMSQMMMEALYCDRIPLPNDFRKLIQTNIDTGGYNLTHVEFSLQRLKENGCHPFSSQEEQGIRNDIAGRMAGLVENPKTIADMRYEAIAFLLDMGRQDLIKPEWVTQILSQQQPNGSWKVRLSQEGTDNSGVDHSTLLALWTLLQLNRPNVPAEPMIHHPN